MRHAATTGLYGERLNGSDLAVTRNTRFVKHIGKKWVKTLIRKVKRRFNKTDENTKTLGNQMLDLQEYRNILDYVIVTSNGELNVNYIINITAIASDMEEDL